jgi:hypothetical protein
MLQKVVEILTIFQSRGDSIEPKMQHLDSSPSAKGLLALIALGAEGAYAFGLLGNRANE